MPGTEKFGHNKHNIKASKVLWLRMAGPFNIFYCPRREALVIIVVSLPFTSYLCGSFIVLCQRRSQRTTPTTAEKPAHERKQQCKALNPPGKGKIL